MGQGGTHKFRVDWRKPVIETDVMYVCRQFVVHKHSWHKVEKNYCFVGKKKRRVQGVTRTSQGLYNISFEEM